MKSGSNLISEGANPHWIFGDERTDPSWLPDEVRRLQEQGVEIALQIDRIRSREMDSIIPGTKLIYTCYGGVLSARKGNVFTFANWYKDKWVKDDEPVNRRYIQVQELLDTGNTEHNLSIYEMEIFNPEIHKEFRMMDAKAINSDIADFKVKYGD